ncbi:ATP-binding cassette domain-containing protein [Pseudactinotalea sp. HY160]|uniref:metal ABC transporter ATP-binding protein n=1 Tax=Pseudactinotalea sp. HY160 TaxID=2654490 RepID=UPI00128CDC28|nr:metal ABC transporter ATP-binding protein [Pseudactinotalea sp. HY160]MPV48666.1 ATP-binding cassette domain-containing protein [Pseudactinotalea sp. HY160]
MTDPALVVRDLTVHYGPVRALDAVSLTLAASRVCGLIGMNGSGKSTLFKAILGQVPLDAGDVSIFGRTPAAARSAGLVGYVPQTEAVDWDFPVSVREVVMMGRYGRMGLLRRPRRADHEAVEQALDRVELTDLAHRQIGRLSGGQRKRAFVARGIAQGAHLMLLDEPFGGVDKRSEAMLVGQLRRLAAGGVTVLVSTHDLAGLHDLADEAILLLRTVLAHGPTASVLTPARLAGAFGLDVLGGARA